MRVEISRSLAGQLLGEAGTAPDREVCGLLFGAPDRIDSVLPCANVASQPADSFELDPAALLAAHRAMRGGGPRLIGHYHSHPSGSATPSPRDAAAAAPDGGLWLIVAGGEIGAWWAVPGGLHGRFSPLSLVLI